MMPEYYRENFNVFVALSPVAKLDNCTAEGFMILADELDDLKYLLVDTLGWYNFFNPDDIGRNTTLTICRNVPQLCTSLLMLLGDPDPSIDNMDRAETIVTHFPSGAGWRTYFHYG